MMTYALPHKETSRSSEYPCLLQRRVLSAVRTLKQACCSRRLMRIKMAERCTACIWHNTPSLSPSPGRERAAAKAQPAAQPASSGEECALDSDCYDQ